MMQLDNAVRMLQLQNDLDNANAEIARLRAALQGHVPLLRRNWHHWDKARQNGNHGVRQAYAEEICKIVAWFLKSDVVKDVCALEGEG